MHAQPNILFIVTDDQTLNGTMAMLPKTRSWFQDQGTAFPKAVATTPLCCPARSSILTGRYAHNTGVIDNGKAICMGTTEDPTIGPDPTNCGHTTAVPNPQRTTVPYYLKQAGYRTAIYGKYLNGWSLINNPPFFTDWGIGNGAYTPVDFNVDGIRQHVWEYSTAYVARQARDFIQRAHDDDRNRPWFLYVAPDSPHSPFLPEPKYKNASVPPFQPPDNYYELDRKDKPSGVQWSSFAGNAAAQYDEDGIQRDWAEHMKMLLSVDDLVEGVMQKVQSLETAERQDTLAFFISDNGFLWGEHDLRGKLVPYLESVRVPLFMRWPGHRVGETSDQLVGNIDLAPTALQAAGIDSNSLGTQMDGRSLIDPSPQPRNRNLTEAWYAEINGVRTSWAAIQTPTFHFIETYLNTKNQDGTVTQELSSQEYYDLVNDPAELTNLLGDSDPKNDPPTDELSAQLAADRTCQGQACPGRENYSSALPPDTAITEKPDATSARDVRFSFSSTQPGSYFRCNLNAHGWDLCDPTTTWSSMPLRAGRNTLEVRAYVSGGGFDNRGAAYTWTVDYSPDTRMNETPPKISTSRDATFTFESPNVTGFKCTLDTPTATGTPEECTSPKTYTGLADGNYTFTARAYDAVTLEEDPHPKTHTWSIDATPPETQVRPDSSACPAMTTPMAMVVCPNTVHGSSMALTSTTSENPVERFECKLDDDPYTACAATKTYKRLSRGMHTVSVRARDLAGNFDPTPATLSWNVGSLQSFATAPDPMWPQIVDGTVVKAIVPDGAGGWYVAGNFTTVGFPVNGVPGMSSAHTDLVHIKADRTIDETWNPATENGEVRTLLLYTDTSTDPDTSTLYVGGTFTRMKGTTDTVFTTRNQLAAISLTGATWGQLTAWNPSANATVNALAFARKTVGESIVDSIYAAGAFTRVHTVLHDKVVELDTTNGVPTSWSPSVGATSLTALVVTGYTNTDCAPGACGYVYAGGAPNVLRKIDRADPNVVTGWNPTPNGDVTALRYRGPVWGGLPALYVGGTFTQIGTPAAARNRVAELNLSDGGSATSWDPSVGVAGTSSGQVNAFIPFNCNDDTSRDPPCTSVVGGAFDTMKIGASSAATRSRLGETDRITGDPDDWNPNLDKAVFALACNPGNSCQTGSHVLDPSRILAVGGSFTTVGGMPRKMLAFFPAPSAAP